MSNLSLIEVAEKQDEIVKSVIGQKNLTGFKKAHTMASAIGQLKGLLNDEYMKPIMELQGTALGFKTDRDLVRNPNGKGYIKGQGYPVEIVRDVVIEAVLKGFQPTGNEFNIISGGFYAAKHGLKRRLDEMEGLKYTIIHTVKSWSVDKGNAAFDTTIEWNMNGSENSKVVPIIAKIDAYSSTDAAIGKADRKAYAWLLNNLTGMNIVDGDVEDIDHTVVMDLPEPSASVTPEEIEQMKEGLSMGTVTLAQLTAGYYLTSEQIAELEGDE